MATATITCTRLAKGQKPVTVDNVPDEAILDLSGEQFQQVTTEDTLLADALEAHYKPRIEKGEVKAEEYRSRATGRTYYHFTLTKAGGQDATALLALIQARLSGQ